MKNEPLLTYEIMDVCLLGGKIMLQSGAETYRVEDTMTRMAAAFGFEDSNSYVTPTGIIFSIEGREPTKTKLIRILQRTTDLEKVAQVNQVSRRISSGEMTLGEAYAQLKHIEASGHTYPFWIQLIAAAISSGCFTIMFMGHWPDFIPSVIAGGAGFLTLHYSHRLVPIKFFSEFAAAFIIGLLSIFFLSHGFGHELDKMIIGSVMPLVPGLLITNAVRDLMVGHLVSGLSKGAEAFLTAFAIGSGIAVVFALM